MFKFEEYRLRYFNFRLLLYVILLLIAGVIFVKSATMNTAGDAVDKKLLGIAIVLFAVATLLGWCFFGEMAVEFLFGTDYTTSYRFLYCLMVFFGSQMTMNLVWELSDFFNALMFIINVTCLFLLRKEIERPE